MTPTSTPTPSLDLDTIREFGPFRVYARDIDVDTGVEPDRYVKTHCCFCGQQCGLQLKVKDNTIIASSRSTSSPSTRGCCARRASSATSSRRTPIACSTPTRRVPARTAASGRSPTRMPSAAWRQRSTGSSASTGGDAFAVLSGASLTTEKTYLMGKFAHMCLRTANTDYNGRLCMVSAAAGNKKTFGIDRAANPWNDILGAEVVVISGANVAECAPITTNYVWQAREQGAKIIVIDPRITPIARTCDLFMPVKPGRDTALFNGVLQLMIENDWLDHDFIEHHTVGFDAVAEQVREWTSRRTAEVTGIAEKTIRQAAEWWGTASTSFLLHARGLEHHTSGVQNVMTAINVVLASGRIGRPNCGYATITGQGNGQGGREHGQKCDQLPGGRDIDNGGALNFLLGWLRDHGAGGTLMAVGHHVVHGGANAPRRYHARDRGEARGARPIDDAPPAGQLAHQRAALVSVPGCAIHRSPP